MKKISKLVVLSALGICLPSLASCGKNKDNEIAQSGRLSIVYYPGGYGSEYLHAFCKNFLAEQKGVSPDEIKSGKDYILKADPDITQSIEDRPIGGMGILIVKKSMDAVDYEYKDGKNILTIKKNL